MAKTKDEETEYFNKNLLLFINVKFLSPITIDGRPPSIREYETITSIGRGTIDKLLKTEGYDVPMSTIRKVCKYAKISLSEFFTMFEAYLQEKKLKQ
ncbi:hypothetical protein [Sphingobacterium faecale]|uniref:Uncharacterized protein n=1 Tax=Sphingobacterium faecale TaxID=2803775 RepID=A0ABS1R9U4_9SPHI|nr:hypothetical protein [Sphingobacterium faecale]MBL1411478.1 hypothetical protein [Sphingobacterium faecale]